MGQNIQGEGKRGRGRPKLEETMNPEWYKIIIDAGVEGKHITQFLIELGISWEGHYRLLKTNKKYSESFSLKEFHSIKNVSLAQSLLLLLI